MKIRSASWLVLALAAACGDAAEHAASNASCDGSELSYDNFGQSFMQRYCTRCHSAAVDDADRQGAPSDHNLDTLDAIHASDLHHIDHMAAAGPESTNTSMPPDGPLPSLKERKQLGEWLACGAP